MTESPDEGDTDQGEEPALADIPLSLEALLDILANRARRFLIEYVRAQPDETAAFEETTKHIITRVARETGRQPNHDDMQVELQHHHLPKLADAGVIEYDIRSQTIRYRPNERLEDLHDRVHAFQAEWADRDTERTRDQTDTDTGTGSTESDDGDEDSEG